MLNYSENCPQVIKDFINYCFVNKNLSQSTLRQYYFDLMQYVKHFSLFKLSEFDITEIKRITIQDINNYLFETTKDKMARTRARKIASLKSFYKWMYIQEKSLDENITEAIDSPKIEKKLPVYLNLQECENLLAVVDGDYKERDECMLNLFLLLGIRLSELVNINLSDIKDGVLKIHGKGNKERSLPLPNTCIDLIEKYKIVRIKPKSDKDAFFISKMKRRISHSMVEKLVDSYIQKAGLDKKYSCHKLRHSFGVLAYEHGNHDIKALQEALGHESLSTTTIYTHIKQDQLKKMIDSSPLNKK